MFILHATQKRRNVTSQRSRGHVKFTNLNKLHACLYQRKHKELFLKCFSLNKSDKEERQVCPLL